MARHYAELLPSNMYQPLATDFAYRAMTSGFIDASDLLNIKSQMVKSICGTNFKLTNESLEEFEQLTKHFYDRITKDSDSNLSHNCQVLADGLELQSKAWKVIRLMVVMTTNGGLSEFIQHVLPADMYINALFGSMIGLDETEIININSALSETGLFRDCSIHLLDLVGLPRGIVDGLIGDKVESYTELIAPLVQLQPSSELTTKDITHLDITALVEFLKVAVNHSLVGTNILLFGPAGTGKTQISRLLADTIGAALIAIKPFGKDINHSATDYESNTSSSRLRLQYHRLVQSVVSYDEKTLLVIDECEDIINDSSSQRGVGREVLHSILETNTTPTIWICNDENYPESFVRRCTFTKHIHIPDNRVMENLINKTSKGLRLSKAFKSILAAKPYIKPANITNVTFVCKTLGVSGKQAEGIIQDMLDESLSACGFDEHKVQYKPQLPFSTEHLNIQGGNKAINQIAKAVNKNGDIRVLLTGPPGTGKTAVVNHLAEQANKELITVRCSDVLDKFVGGTEKNIARLFREAEEKEAVLFFDEIDSLLQNREDGLTHNFEIQQINELLTQIECFNYPFFAATNFSSRLDKAVMRRFDFKLHFEYLTSPQVLTLYDRLLGQLVLPNKIRKKLSTLKLLTPGDFAIVSRRQQISTTKLSHAECLEILTTENNCKQKTKAIGFVH